MSPVALCNLFLSSVIQLTNLTNNPICSCGETEIVVADRSLFFLFLAMRFITSFLCSYTYHFPLGNTTIICYNGRMVISHYGAGMVKVAQGETTAVFNPIGESPDYKTVKFGADLALVSLDDKRYNGAENAARGERIPFVVNGPGEYEVGGIFIKGFGTAGPKGKINTAYSLVLEGTNLVHLGALSQEEIPAKIIEELGMIDVLFVPIGNNELLSPKAAAKLATNLGSRLVIPVDYDSEDKLKTFLKEFGTEKPAVLESLTFKRKDILEKEGEVVVIKSY